MSLIHVQNQSWNLNNSPNYTCHSRTLIFLFYLSLFCSGVTVYMESHRMESTVGLGDSNFFSTGLPSLFFVYFHSNLPPQNLLLSGFQWIMHRWDIVVLIHTLLLPICYSGVIYFVALCRG